MKIKRITLAVLIFIIIGSIPVYAAPCKSAVMIGEILEVQNNEEEKTIKLLVDGYIKGQEISKEQVLILVNEETVVMDSSNDTKEKIEFEKGDKVYIRLSEAMTKSIPPQSVAKRIYISKK
ncbi:hypothetical protein [Clostridium chauvoei]|uniref:DUF3221 domain-containing protein n=2 Tax=Clostridium chauvoei TaxID=46867 RepID=S6F0F3_9CLOT|nr:hypothetical protein [Clostridium chauvoei]ATD55356.1 hypothetical protein BTM20_08935 [Clostridium chauvoei]ATD56971.1 hypothetical protein BTM21_04105 [Clostridium chauvoei]MBX7280868.1 hypothetical protein [Clostridium chauvoei]MBX7283351.1 hypothetical protein [Clostridium chauvoei]MBX7285825.1 hypothetical protein [Clostridium chauvoei]